MQYERGFRIFTGIFPLLFLTMSCEYTGPEAIWNPDYDAGTPPVIDSISPESTAEAGVTEIVIHGRNFSSDPDSNLVYFDNVRVDVKRAQTTQLTVYRPNLVAENMTIMVMRQNAVSFSQFAPYSVASIGGLYALVKNLGKANALAVDASGNLMVHVDKKELHRVTPDGELALLLEKTKPRIVYDMKAGPGDMIYFSRDQNYINRIPLTGGEYENFANGTPGNIKYFDWDANLNLYAGGEMSGLIRILPDGTFANSGLYKDFDIRSIRIFNNAVYLAALYAGSDSSLPAAGIWKNAITSVNGDLGESTLVLDWAESGSFSETLFKDITFDENGVLYVATDGGADASLDPMLMMTPDGSVDAFYKGGILQGPILDMAWGNDAVLYYIRSTDDINLSEIYRLSMAAGGAPDFGRQ